MRIVDCVGDINPAYATYDSQGNIINEPWPASSIAGSEGFCLAGVGVINVLASGTWTGGASTSWANRKKLVLCDSSQQRHRDVRRPSD